MIDVPRRQVLKELDRRSLRPLAPTTYLFRNTGKTLPLMGVIMLAVMLIAGILSMINSIPLSIRTIYSYSKYSLGVSPRSTPDVIPSLVARIENGSPVPLDKTLVCRASGAEVKSIVGKWPFVVLGLTPEDMQYFMKRLKVRRIEGRVPKKGLPEVIISEPVARNLTLRLGDVLLGPTQQESYSPKEVKVVGIAHTEEWFMLDDIDYQRQNHFPPIEHILAFAKNERDQARLDKWAEKEFKGERVQIFAYHQLEKQSTEMFQTLYRILDVVIGTLVLVITVMMGMLINIYQSQRLVEFGLLQAIGYTKNQLLRRVMIETVSVLVFGWALGLGVAVGLLNIVKIVLMDPQGYALSTFDQTAFLYTVPVPISIMIVATLTVFLRFRRFDPVSVVERRLV